MNPGATQNSASRESGGDSSNKSHLDRLGERRLIFTSQIGNSASRSPVTPRFPEKHCSKRVEYRSCISKGNQSRFEYLLRSFRVVYTFN